MNKRISLLISALLALALLCPLCPAAWAEEETIHIYTVQDLMDLSERCSLDTWSNGRKVVLENDLSLSGTDFQPIPTFNGDFDGGGHSILDLTLDAAQSPCGLFLETGKDAHIHNLSVTGTVTPRGDESMVGGLVGRNRGTVTGCTFTGTVAANDRVGGIAGKNEATGLVTGCTVSGNVRGLNATGGVVGENIGAIAACGNHSFVNTESVDPSVRLDTLDTSSVLNLLGSLRADSAGVTTDTGGIAGSSTGFIEHCTNSGTVGYLHLGYHVGGIAGRSGGYVNGCRNSGEVYGRKDVGGVAGRAEPYVETAESENVLAGLGYRFYALNRSIDNAINDAKGISDELAERLGELPALLRPAADRIAGLDLKNRDNLPEMRTIVTDCVHALSGRLDDISGSVGDNSEVMIGDMREINSQLDALSGTAMQAAYMLSGAEASEDVLVDDSALAESAELTLGKVAFSDNEGSVYGDSNVGGIIGGVSVENDPDSENAWSEDTEALVKKQISLRAAVIGCVNRGEITAKRECAGGIVGKMDFGYAASCAAYGPVCVEDGDYTGGICGLCYGQISNCWAKCAVSAKKYVGGVVGNGYAARGDSEASSRISGCYALVDIRDDPQFAGAVSGGGDGVYEGNYFVPAGYAALDKRSIHGQAEPMDFADFAAVESVPEACKRFTLRFVVEGETVKEVPFQYGDSFDRSVFPDVARRDGAYAVWDRTDLNDLRFDTVVTAEYRMDETVLRSEAQREDGRAAVYVDGRFQQGDSLTLEQIPVGEDDIQMFSVGWKETIRAQLRSIFREGAPDYSIPVAVEERLRVGFPDDGLTSHTLRYLTPNGQTKDCRVYLAVADGWQRLHPRTFGSYFLFDVPGSEAELAIVTTIQSWWVAVYLAALLVLLALLVFAIVKIRKWLRARPKKEKKSQAAGAAQRWLKAHKKAVGIGAGAVLIVAVGAVAVLRFGGIGTALSASRLLKSFAQQETDIQAEILIHANERDVELSATVQSLRQDDRMIRCMEQYGIPLYISDGMAYFETGRSFRVGGLGGDNLLELAPSILLHGGVHREKADDGVTYEVTADSEAAERILRCLLPESYSERLHPERMTVSIFAREGTLTALSFTGEGMTESGTPFTVSGSLTPQPMTERRQIPQAVLDAMAAGGEAEAETLSEDLLRLLAAWIKYESAESVAADISVSADCGSVHLDPRYEYSRCTVEDTDIHCVRGNLFAVYYTDSAACTESGADLSEAQQYASDTAKLIPIARELSLKGRFDCAVDGSRAVYTLTLDAESAADIAARLMPELDTLGVSYRESTLKITLEDNALQSIELDCGGSLRVVLRDVETSLRVAVRLVDRAVETVPVEVRTALLK